MDPDSEGSRLDWSYLLNQEAGKRGAKSSLLQKWSGSIEELRTKGPIHEASLLTNRIPSPEFSAALEGFRVNFGACEPAIRSQVIDQLGTEKSANSFFETFRFGLKQAEPSILEEGLKQRLLRLNGTEQGWKNLLDEIHRWMKFRDGLSGSEMITVQSVRRAALWQQLPEMQEDFSVPADYVLPSKDFHSQFLNDVARRSEPCLVVWGSPGVGKSTYLSFCVEDLKKDGYAVVRHHYFLPSSGSLGDRYDHQRVALVLMQQIAQFIEMPSQNPRPSLLCEWLARCGAEYDKKGKVLVVILDGLDHVYRDRKSIDELNRLFELLLPSPPGVIVVIGTQRVADDLTPPKLLENAPYAKWHQLPRLNSSAIMQWLERKENLLDLPSEEPGRRNRLVRLSEAFELTSSGHPLHLKYSFQALVQAESEITPESIRALPACPDGEITRYYDRLWQSLSLEGKSILTLFAVTKFTWPKNGLVDSLGGGLDQSLKVARGVQDIRHLLGEDELGLSIFHNSLLHFVTQVGGYEEAAKPLRRQVIAWLSEKAPDYWRWAYLWREQADNGVSRPLIDGPDNEWVVTAVADSKPDRIIADILEESKGQALAVGAWGRMAHVGLLESYVKGHLDYYRELVDRLLAINLLIGSDAHLVPRLITELRLLPASSMVVLATWSFANRQSDISGQCLDSLVARWREPNARDDHHYRPTDDEVLAHLELAVLRGNIQVEKALRYFRDVDADHARRASQDGGTSMVGKCAEALWRRRDVATLKSLAALDLDRREGAEVAASLVRLAAEERFDVVEDRLCGTVLNDPLTRTYLCLENKTSGVGSASGPDFSCLKRRRLLFGPQTEVERVFQSAFFSSFVSHLGGSGSPVWVGGLIGVRWVDHLLTRLDVVAADFAKRFSEQRRFSYRDLFILLIGFPRPAMGEDEDGAQFAIYAMHALHEIAIDLLLLARKFNGPPRLEVADIQVCLESPHWNLEWFLNEYLSTRRAWMSAQAAGWLISRECHRMSDIVEELYERGGHYARLGHLAALHPDTASLARELSLRAARCLIGHGHHKDILLFNVLDTIESAHKAGVSRCADRLYQIIPMIAAVGEFTDGDETHALAKYLAKTLMVVCEDRLPSYYGFLCDGERFADAEEVMNQFVKASDLNDPINSAIAHTVLNVEGLRILQDRADAHDAGSSLVISDLKEFLGGLDLTDEFGHKPSVNENTPERSAGESSPEPANFQPQHLAQFIEALPRFSYDEAMKRWLSYWKERRPRDSLDAVQTLIEKGVLSISHSTIWDELFELKLQLDGKSEAWPLLVSAQRRNSGWTNYYPTSLAERRWRLVKDLYPDRWREFMQLTLMPEPDGYKGAFNMHSNVQHIVDYLLMMERYSEAEEVMDALIVATLERGADLHFPALPWQSENAAK